MKKLLTIAASLLIAAASASAQPINEPTTGIAANIDANWVGVWQSKLEGIPSLELTLGDDAGQLNGTLVMHIVFKEKGGQPHTGSTEPHTLINPRLEGDKLSFQIKRGNGSNEILNLHVELSPGNKAQFTCENCGPTHAELERIPIKTLPPANPD